MNSKPTKCNNSQFDPPSSKILRSDERKTNAKHHFRVLDFVETRSSSNIPRPTASCAQGVTVRLLKNCRRESRLSRRDVVQKDNGKMTIKKLHLFPKDYRLCNIIDLPLTDDFWFYWLNQPVPPHLSAYRCCPTEAYPLLSIVG